MTRYSHIWHDYGVITRGERVDPGTVAGAVPLASVSAPCLFSLPTLSVLPYRDESWRLRFLSMRG